jgi:Flp pilus assembly CpaF family ATPase
MALMSDVDLPVAHVRAQVASAIDLVVHTARLRDAGGSVFQIAGVDDPDGAGEPVVIEVLGQRDHSRGQARAHERTVPADPRPDFFQPRDQQFGVL